MAKNIGKFILIFISMLLVLSSILIIVNLIPKEYIENNVKESVQTFINEGYFPKVSFTYNYLLDNYTDALMINTAYSVDSNEPLKSALLMRRNYRPNEDLILEKIDNENNTILNFILTIEETNTTYYEYSRYWHGYMSYLRPLLVFFNYSEIRIILTTIIIILSLILIYLTYKKIDKYVCIATIFMLLISSFYAIGLSIQYTSVFMIMLIASIYIISKYKTIKNIYIVFFCVGALTSFFDLLTTPVLTLGIPAIYYITLKNRETESKKINFNYVFKIILSWGVGYALMWISKWLISDLLCQTSTVSRALQKISLLSNSKEQFNPNIFTVVSSNISYLSITLLVSIICTAILSFSITSYKDSKKKIPYILFAIIPFVWFIIIKNHSYVHARFTYRNLLLTVLALSIITMENIKEYISTRKKS